jgi:hypothetical protein
VDWIHLAHDRDKGEGGGGFFNMAMNLLVP